MSLDSTNLRVKELEMAHLLLTNRRQEMVESRLYRTEGKLLPPAPETPSTPELDQALGLSTPLI